MNITSLILPLCVWFMAGLCCVSPPCAQASVFHSSSGQFTAREVPGPKGAPALTAKPVLRPVGTTWAYLVPTAASSASTNKEEVTLDASLLVAQCERIKSTLLAQLGEVDNWQGRIDLIINPAMATDSGPQLAAVRHSPGWTYELMMPKKVVREVFLRKFFQTLLLEMANRHAATESDSVEIPLWLVEGMGAHLEANSLEPFVLQPGQTVLANIVWNKTSQMMPLEMRGHRALSFQQLSWPTEADLTPDGLARYRSCAQLFVEGLLKFDDGTACLRSMIDQLAEHWNWQTAFLQAFHTHFGQLLDVEKWWGVNYINGVRGYKTQAWSADDSRRTLQNSVDVPIEVHFESNQPPAYAKVTLQEVIRQWNPAEAYNAIQKTIGELRFLAARGTGEWRPLSQLYIKTLQDYLEASKALVRDPMLGKHAPPLLKIAKDEAVRQLNALDQQRDVLWKAATANSPQLRASEEASSGTVAVH